MICFWVLVSASRWYTINKNHIQPRLLILQTLPLNCLQCVFLLQHSKYCWICVGVNATTTCSTSPSRWSSVDWTLRPSRRKKKASFDIHRCFLKRRLLQKGQRSSIRRADCNHLPFTPARFKFDEIWWRGQIQGWRRLNACDPEAPAGTLQSTVGQLLNEQPANQGPQVHMLSYSSLTSLESRSRCVSGMNMLCISTHL